MSDESKLIAQARELSEYVTEHIPGSRYKPVIDRLANALEKAIAERDEALAKLAHVAELCQRAQDEGDQAEWPRPVTARGYLISELEVLAIIDSDYAASLKEIDDSFKPGSAKKGKD